MKNSNLKRILVAAYEVFYEKRRLFRLRAGYSLRIMNPESTIKYIKKHRCSIARYGDGEFDLVLKSRDLGFQPQSQAISDNLKRVLGNKRENLLLCVPRCMNTIKGCNKHSGTFWIEWGKNGHHEQIISMIRAYAGRNYLFGDAQITRPYIDWVTDARARRTFPMLKRLWTDKDIMIVEGEQTRMGVGNDLFDGARTIKRILAPAVGAFERYEEIKQTILNHYNGELIVMALGPTATILAADFAEMDIQALDIGNIDIEYEWFLRGAKERIAIPGKFTNEAKDGRTFSACSDEKYLGEIVARIGC